MAHEVNNPLAYVINNLAVLQRDVRALMNLIQQYRALKGPLSPGEPRAVAAADRLEAEMDFPYIRENLEPLFKTTREGLHRIRGIVQNLRDFVRLDEAQLKEANLREGLNATAELLRHEITSKGLQLTKAYQDIP